MKALKFVGSSLDDLRGFPADARRQAGFELDALQRGFEPSDWKPMKDVGAGVREVRIHVSGEWRIIYVARFADAVLCSIHFKRRPRKRGNPILSWPAPATAKLEVNHERADH